MISFFTHSGGAGIIRGEQVARKLGAKINPKGGYDDDVCIYIKCIPPEYYPKNSYIDVVEDSAGLRWLKQKNRPIKVIASSKSIYNYLSNILPNKIVLIPQHHFNFKRQIRVRKEIKVAGIIGNKASFQYSLKEVGKELNKIDITLKTLIKKKFDSREEVVDFYKQIDLQLVWRPKSDDILHNPLKLINALSFGIPTFTYPEENFMAEFKDYIFQSFSIYQLLSLVGMYKKTTEFQKIFFDKAIKKAEEYHIDHISKLYLRL
jgi:hypothetical protein